MRAAVVGIFSFLLFAVASTQALAGGPFPDDVVLIYCEREQMFSGGIIVTHSSSSPGAPVVPVSPLPDVGGPNVSCAEELAKLAKAKFRIHSIIPADSAYVVYTLVRQ